MYKQDEHDFALDRRQEPETLTVLGRSLKEEEGFGPVGYHQQDRALHTHIIGQTGGGKSTLLENIALQDMRAGRGGMFIDPHGDSAVRLAADAPVEAVAAGRIVYLDFGAAKEDLVVLNPFEVLDVTSAESRQDAVATALDLLHRVSGIDGGDVRLMKYLQKSLATLAFWPDKEGSVHGGATLLDIMPLFMNSSFREVARRYVTDRTLLDWWQQGFENTPMHKVVEDTMALENRLAPILNDSRLAAVLGEARSTLDLADTMDSGRYVIVNLDKGHNSEAFRRVVGSTLLNQVVQAAFGRQRRTPEAERRRFHLMVDEFQNFTTRDFGFALEEARKYGLGITVAHQSMSQLDGQPQVVRSMGCNIGSRITYGVGYDDARYLSNYMAPLTVQEIANLPAYHAAAKLRQGGERGLPAFKLVTLPPEEAPEGSNCIEPLRPSPSAGGPLSSRSYLPSLLDSGQDGKDFVVL